MYFNDFLSAVGSSRLSLKLFAAIGCLVFGIGLTLLIPSANMTTNTEILTVVNKYHTALIKQDEDTLKSVLLERVRVISQFEDSVLSKTEILESLQSLPGKLNSIEVSNVRITSDANTAMVECLVRMILISDSSNEIAHHGIYTFEIKKNDDKWKIAKIQLKIE